MKILKMLLLITALSFLPAHGQEVKVNEVDFNSSYDDFSPVLMPNGKMMIFTSERNGRTQEVYSISNEDGKWGTAKKLSGDVNDGKHNGSIAMTPDGQYMIFAAYEHDKQGEGRTDLYSARKVNGEWTDITNLGPAVNSSAWDSNPTLSSDGKYLIFASDRDGGQGGSDIYMSRRTREGWSKAMNAGSVINSSSDELTPHLAWDDKKMTFASNRGGGQGGYDIYFSEYGGGQFRNVRNAGAPINTGSNEYSYFILVNSNQAYFASDRAGRTALDIYTAVPNPLPADAVVNVIGKVRDAESKDPLGADIIVTDLTSGEQVAELRSDDETGDYSVILQPGREYSITADKEGYIFYSERFTIPAAQKGTTITKDIDLQKIVGGKTRLLVFFDYDKTDLKSESKPEMERVVNFLSKYQDINISLEGHTDDQGEETYNQTLSDNRAKTVKKYLTDKGISDARIKTVGYGESKPAMEGTSEEVRAVNRRVEMVIVK